MKTIKINIDCEETFCGPCQLIDIDCNHECDIFGNLEESQPNEYGYRSLKRHPDCIRLDNPPGDLIELYAEYKKQLLQEVMEFTKRYSNGIH